MVTTVMVIISGFGRRGVMTVPAGFRGLVGRGLQEQSNLLHLGKLFVVVVVVEVAEEIVHSGEMLGNAPLTSTLCPQIRLVGLPNEGKQHTAVI